MTDIRRRSSVLRFRSARFLGVLASLSDKRSLCFPSRTPRSPRCAMERTSDKFRITRSFGISISSYCSLRRFPENRRVRSACWLELRARCHALRLTRYGQRCIPPFASRVFSIFMRRRVVLFAASRKIGGRGQLVGLGFARGVARLDWRGLDGGVFRLGSSGNFAAGALVFA